MSADLRVISRHKKEVTRDKNRLGTVQGAGVRHWHLSKFGPCEPTC